MMRRKVIISAIALIAAITVAVAIAWQYVRDTASPPATPAADAGTLAPDAGETQKPDEAAGTSEPAQSPASGEPRRINVYITDKDYLLGMAIEEYAKKNWDFPYEIKVYEDSTVFSTYGIMQMVNASLLSGDGAVDIYVLPDLFAPYYLKGEYSQYACTYKELGIDVESALKKADIPEYAVGRNSDGEVIAIDYLAAKPVFMYRRSIAIEVWGTDDPDRISEVIGGGTQSWYKFLEAAKTLKRHGYYIAPGYRDLTWMINVPPYPFTGDPWYEGDIDPTLEKHTDVFKQMFDNGYIADYNYWPNEWYNETEGDCARIFGSLMFLGETDYIDETFGDWAICMPPFTARFPSHIGIMVNKASPNKDLLGPLVEWITLDCSENGLQYGLATGTFLDGDVVGVLSRTVLKNTKTTLDVLGGQDINPVLYKISKQHVQKIGWDFTKGPWYNALDAYLHGEKDKESVIRQLKDETKNDYRYWPPNTEAPTGKGKAGEKPIVWKDKNFEAAIRERLFTPTWDIYESDLDGITYLWLKDLSIESIEDIVHFKNLVSLNLSKNKITDISILKELTRLKYLDLSLNNINDISALSGMAELKELYINNNKITDISALLDKPNLKHLDAARNNISDISSLGGLTNLEYLNLSDNKIVDASALKRLTKLSYLNLEYNDIADISSLGNLKNLETLLLNGNNISDISVVKGMKKLKRLTLAGSDIADKSPADHVESVTW